MTPARARLTTAMLALAVLASWSLAIRSAVAPQPAAAAPRDAGAVIQAGAPDAAGSDPDGPPQAADRGRISGAGSYAERQPPAVHRTIWVRDGRSVELRESPGGSVIASVGDTTEFGSPTSFSVVERRGDWAGVPTAELPNGELGWVRLDPQSVGQGSTEASLRLDLSKQRAQLLEGERVTRSFTVTIGAPDTPTPIGRFAVTDELTSGLNYVYGCCAIALAATQPHLPAGWTGGDRIAIHGNPEDSAGGATSNGCPHARAADLRATIEALPLGAPVVIEP